MALINRSRISAKGGGSLLLTGPSLLFTPSIIFFLLTQAPAAVSMSTTTIGLLTPRNMNESETMSQPDDREQGMEHEGGMSSTVFYIVVAVLSTACVALAVALALTCLRHVRLKKNNRELNCFAQYHGELTVKDSSGSQYDLPQERLVLRTESTARLESDTEDNVSKLSEYIEMENPPEPPRANPLPNSGTPATKTVRFCRTDTIIPHSSDDYDASMEADYANIPWGLHGAGPLPDPHGDDDDDDDDYNSIYSNDAADYTEPRENGKASAGTPEHKVQPRGDRAVVMSNPVVVDSREERVERNHKVVTREKGVGPYVNEGAEILAKRREIIRVNNGVIRSQKPASMAPPVGGNVAALCSKISKQLGGQIILSLNNPSTNASSSEA